LVRTFVFFRSKEINMYSDLSGRTPRRRAASARRAGLRLVALTALFALVALPVIAANAQKERSEGIAKVKASAKVVREIMGAKDNSIPDGLLADAECVAVFPGVIKGAFIFGGSGGSGCAVVRDPQTGRFGQPIFLKIGGGSVGFQIGASSTDFLLMGVNRDAQKTLTRGEWTLGADAAVAAGPVGRSAKAGTDWKLDAQFLSYSRSKGAFAGVALDGSKITVDRDRNSAFYGPNATPEQIIRGEAKPAPQFVNDLSTLSATLARFSPPKPDSRR
jgi:lipid-binding SYLF domain-containing protein